jgi:hypothetical protein
MAPPLNAKFVRAHYAHPAPQSIPNGGTGWILRLVYEFWGFCVHGSNDLVQPGGFATSQLTGSYLSMPAGFESGSTVLLASGSDGATAAGLPYFNAASAPFSASYVGKWLTTWQSGSTSTDDSIYEILGWINSSSIVVDPTMGGTPTSASGSTPQLTTRTGVNYRVIDYHAVSGLAFASGQYMVLQFNDAFAVNPGQVNSQVKVSGDVGFTTFSQVRLRLSPSGSWDGTHFLNENYPEIIPEVTLGGGYGGAGQSDWWHGSGNAGQDNRGFVTLIAGTGFLICSMGGPWINAGGNNAGSCFHIEVPTRLYPRANDPNLICAINMGNMVVGFHAVNGYGFGHRFFPSPYDVVQRRWASMTRSYTGSSWNTFVWPGGFNSGGTVETGNTTRWSLFDNPRTNKFLMSDGVLSSATFSGQPSAAGQFSLARARLRTMRFTSGNNLHYIRVGDGVDRWIHIGGGVMWPWDHSVVSNRPMFSGF